MKEIIKAFFLYLLILSILFIFLFCSIIIFHILPIFKLGLKEQQIINLIQTLIQPSFYHALFNSLIFSIFIYGITILVKYRKFYYLLLFLTPIIISSIIVFLVLFYFNPKSENLNFNRTNDARLYFTEKTFFEHYGKKLYFDNITKNKINNLIMIEGNIATFHNNSDVEFLEDRILIYIPMQNAENIKLEFMREQLQDFNVHNTIINKIFMRWFNNISYKFIASSDLISNLLLWVASAFFILSAIGIIIIANYPFLTLIYNFLFILSFYILFNFTYDMYHKVFFEISSYIFIKEILLSIATIIVSIVFQGIRFLFIKTHIIGNE